MMVICIKQHLSKIWNLIHEKAKQHWCWVEKSVAYKKRVYFNFVVGVLDMNTINTNHPSHNQI